jgi:chaperonin GroES
MKFRPLHDRVVVRRIEEDMKTAGGIIIPDTAKEKPMQAEVIAVGPGARDESGQIVPLDVKKGDRVLFGKMVGHRGEDRRRRAPDHEGERHSRRHRGKSLGARRGLIAALSALILGSFARLRFLTRAEVRG